MYMKKDPLAVLMGQNILHFRKAAGLTQAQLAEKINVGTTFISRVERGEKFVSIKVLKALSETFHVSYDALLRGPEYNTSLQNIHVLLDGRSEAYVAWIEEVLRACADHPAE